MAQSWDEQGNVVAPAQSSAPMAWDESGKPVSASVEKHSPTVLDRLITGATGDVMRPPDETGDVASRVVNGLAGNLGRTTQAWHDMFTGHANPMTAAEMVPLVGPAAVDTGRMLATPGQRVEGVGSALAMAAPALIYNMEAAPAPVAADNGAAAVPSLGSRVLSRVKAAAPDIASGAAKVAGGELLAKVPGMEFPARIGMGYPGVRQMGTGITKLFRSGEPVAPAGTPAVTARSPVESIAPPPVSILPSGVARIGTTAAEAIQGLSRSSEGTVGTRAEMMRQLRLADQNGTTDAGKAAIIRRFEAPEYAPRPER